jgi:hypothetical protein
VNAAEKAKAEPRKRHPRGRLARIKGLIGEQPALIIGACLLLLGLVLVAFVAKVLDLSDGALLAIVSLSPDRLPHHDAPIERVGRGRTNREVSRRCGQTARGSPSRTRK